VFWFSAIVHDLRDCFLDFFSDFDFDADLLAVEIFYDLY